MLRRSTAAIAVLVSLCSLLSIASGTTASAVADIAGMSVFLDPGHSGASDSSITRQVTNGRGGTKDCQTTGTATSDGYPEHSFTWAVVLQVRDALNRLGVLTEISRDNDNTVGPCIDQRAAAANAMRPNAIVSIHADGGPSSGRGFHVNYSSPPLNDSQSGPAVQLATIMRDSLVASGLQESTYIGSNGLYGRADSRRAQSGRVSGDPCRTRQHEERRRRRSDRKPRWSGEVCRGCHSGNRRLSQREGSGVATWPVTLTELARHIAASPTRRRSRRTRIALAIAGVVSLVFVLGVAAAGGVVVGHHLGSGSSSREATPPTSGQATPSSAVSTPAQPTPSTSTTLADDFKQLQDGLQAQVGVVIAPVGNGNSPLIFGDWKSGPAWSTIKVPLAIAALREEEPPHVTDEMRAAITESDNAAAESIWQGLGTPVIAAHKVEDVLRQTGDDTVVQSQKVRPEFTAFGQTDWPLTEQTRFLAVAACDASNKPILDLMGQVEASQAWGLGRISWDPIQGRLGAVALR